MRSAARSIMNYQTVSFPTNVMNQIVLSRAEGHPFMIDHFENGEKKFSQADIPLNLIPAFSDQIGKS